MKLYQGLQYQELLERIAQNCVFSKGREAVLTTVPVFKRLAIDKSCKQTREALDCVLKYGTLPFEGIRDIEEGLKAALRDSICSVQDLLNVVDHERGLISMQNYMKKVELPVVELQELIDSFMSHPDISKKIESCISSYGEVMDSASPELASIRRRLKRVEAELSREAQKFISSHNSKLMDSIVASRNNRIVVLAKIAEKNSLGGFIHGESASGQTAYVEPACLVALNNEKQVLFSAQEEEIERILFECSQKVKEGANHYLDNLMTMALLDGIFAKANFGKTYDGIVAELTENKELLFKNARHPFIDPKQVVANTYRIQDPTRLLLITGPNTGGKTVSLKVIGLFVLMTYSGIPVCADEAQVPFFDEVYLDLTDDQSIEASLSTFSAHISKLTQITDHVTSQSLVLLDEIGSGTDPKEGESLAIAVLDDLRSRGCMIVATTHYGRLKSYGKKHADILLASVHFDVEKMTPTFRYMEGLTGQSNALTIARRFGLKQSILERAEQLKQSARSTEDELIEKLESQIMETQQLQQELSQKLQKTQLLEKELKQAQDTWIMQKENMLDKAQLEAQEYVEKIRMEADLYFEEMKQQVQIKPHEYNDFKQKLTELDPIQEESDSLDTHPFKIGDAVSLQNSNQIGQVISFSNGKAIIEVNGLKITARETQMRHRVAPEKKVPAKNQTISHVKPQITMECNLIGMRVDEAVTVFEKYMDDAILASLPTVRIIHGSGTGALRNAIQARLKKRKDVEFRMGGQGEGGVGATVVTFISRKKL